MEFLQYLGMGFLIGCLFTVIGVEIGRAIKKKKEVRDAVDFLASALRIHKIPKEPYHYTFEGNGVAFYLTTIYPMSSKDKFEIVWTNDDVKKANEKIQERREKQFIEESERHKSNCKHGEYLKELTGELDKMNLTFINRHWLYTTAFTYLHHDKDHCDCNEENKETIKPRFKSKQKFYDGFGEVWGITGVEMYITEDWDPAPNTINYTIKDKNGIEYVVSENSIIKMMEPNENK